MDVVVNEFKQIHVIGRALVVVEPRMNVLHQKWLDDYKEYGVLPEWPTWGSQMLDALI